MEAPQTAAKINSVLLQMANLSIIAPGSGPVEGC